MEQKFHEATGSANVLANEALTQFGRDSSHKDRVSCLDRPNAAKLCAKLLQTRVGKDLLN
jgi:hypothetical protein